MSNKIERCECKNITNNKICHNKSRNIMILNNKRICNFHYWYYHNIYSIIIQKYYKGYKQRKLIKNIYINLPIDLQKHIIYFIRQDHYYKRYKLIINKIIEPKLSTLISELYNLWYNDNQNLFSIYLSNNINYVINTYELYKKYYMILNKNITKNMYQHFKNILKIYYLYDSKIYDNNLDSNILNNIQRNIENIYFSLAKIFESIEI